MVIESGFWNYYMSFRIENNKKFFQNLHKKDINFIMGFVKEGKVYVEQAAWEDYFEKRRMQMKPILERREQESWDELTEQEMYVNDELPEYYFDFLQANGTFVDKLEVVFNEEISEIRECNCAAIGMTKEINSKCWKIFSLMPLKIEKRPFEYEYCPVHLYLFENGYAVIKTSIRLEMVDSAAVSTYPVHSWFGDVKVCESVFLQKDSKEYKICKNISGNEHQIFFVTNILQRYIDRIFADDLLHKGYYFCYETFVIAKIFNGRQIWEIPSKGSIQEKSELYHLANPEEFLSIVTSERWNEFWKKSYQYFGGFDWVKGHNCRLIISTDMEALKSRYHRLEIKDEISYLEASLQRSFDFFLVLALCQKDGEIYLSRVSQETIHDIDRQIAKYNQDRIFLASFLDTVPYNVKVFYSMICEMNKTPFIDTKTKLQHMKQIDDYQRNLLLERRTLLAELVALIGTILFGLPMLYDTLCILRNVLLKIGIYLSVSAVENSAIYLWLVLILIIGGYLIRAYAQYRKKIP